jgi:hypothetical protein
LSREKRLSLRLFSRLSNIQLLTVPAIDSGRVNTRRRDLGGSAGPVFRFITLIVYTFFFIFFPKDALIFHSPDTPSPFQTERTIGFMKSKQHAGP